MCTQMPAFGTIVFYFSMAFLPHISQRVRLKKFLPGDLILKPCDTRRLYRSHPIAIGHLLAKRKIWHNCCKIIQNIKNKKGEARY
ncbi:hypothetical protein DSY1565 [Desulfitobacterium hafniense Y51]|uniref:Uncharacterized protein n=1 Tax=Desulfitobacterium hafniense (strain Y51) TaxID=138119 RepID=Q24X88_DESHY|nr:hypothetical protein DSY1565 [Desulfitobacterium hafniense Y51]